MGKGLNRAVLGALLVVVLASSLATVVGARTSSAPNYTLLGYVELTSGAPVPAGVTVDLISSATHQTYSTVTTPGSGQFSFSSAGNAPELAPGWWGLKVPPQAHVRVAGVDQAVLPVNQSWQFFHENSSALVTQKPVTLYGVQMSPYNATINGTVTYGRPWGGASVELLAPAYNGFVLGNNTTSLVNNKSANIHIGYFSLTVPWGSWILRTTIPQSSPHYYSYTSVVVNSTTVPAKGNITVNPVVSTSRPYVTWGYVKVAPSGTNDPNGGNVTVFAPTTGAIYSQGMNPGGFYSIGTYGSQTFNVILSTVGYTTAWYSLTVSPANPNGTPLPKNVLVSPAAPPASYLTTLNWSKGFQKLNVSTDATLLNDSVFPELANASVGQLWAQLGLDWQHALSFSSANLASVYTWANSSGPFFHATQAQVLVGQTGFNETRPATFGALSNCAGSCGLASPAWIKLHWDQGFNATSTVNASSKSYGFSFNFRHPTNGQTFNYTVVLPSGYVLQAGAPLQPQTALVPAGKGGTWTAFTLVSKPSGSPSGTATFTAVKYGNVTAAVNISSKQFTWSEKNVINSTRGHYAAIAGTGENLSFSALNSTFPAGTNGTLFHWVFGDTVTKNTTTGTTYHTYSASGNFSGSVTVTSSGGRTSTAPFNVYAGSLAPVATLSVNGTPIQTASNGARYLIVNWSTTLHFNASKSTSTIYAGAPVSGIISVADLNISTVGGKSTDFNVSRAGLSADPLTNHSYSFLGGGKYLTQGTAANGSVVLAAFLGWQYNVSLKVWDAGGHSASTSMVLLVKDTQKPTPALTLKDSKGKVVPSAGLVEGANHTAFVQFSYANTTDPNNGSVVWYNLTIKDSKNASVNISIPIRATAPTYAVPSPVGRWLDPQTTAYSVNLTVTDRAGNKAWVTSPLSIAVDTSKRPILAVSNLTAPATMTDGTTYTVWANVTNTVGKNSTAQALSVRFYIQAPSGGGPQIAIGGSPASVKFYNYTSGAVDSTPVATGSYALAYNKTVRAVISWTPARTGTWALWVNATAANEFAANYGSGANQAKVMATLNANPVVQYEEYGAIAAAAVVIIVGIVFYYRRRVARPATKPSPGGRLERGAKKDEDEEE